MMNRVREFLELPEERARAPDFWVVRTREGACFWVSEPVARALLRRVARLWRPRWTQFYDLSGSLISLRTRAIVLVGEASAEQRSFDRRLLQLLERESDEEGRLW